MDCADWKARSRRLVGEEGIKRLDSSHVLLLGLGGVGSFCAEALVRSGIGALTIVDYDTIDSSNINRQLPALSDTLGRVKTDVLSERLLSVNPDLRLRGRDIKINAENISGELDEYDNPPDFIADAIDDLPAKTAIAIAATRRGIRLISCMGAAFRLDPSMLMISDISQTHTCPLAKRFRRMLKDAGVTEGVPVVWSKEKPLRETVTEESVDEPGDTLSLSVKAPGPASMVFVPGAAGLLMASYIVRQIVDGTRLC